MERIEFVPKRTRLIGIFLGTLIFVALGMFMQHIPQMILGHFDWSIMALGAITVLFFGACAAVAVKQFFDRRPRLILDDDGLFDRTLATPVIPWASILGAEITQIKRSKFISLTLIDEEQRLANLPAYKRWMTSANRSIGFRSFNVNLSALGVSAERVLELMRERMK